MMKPYVNNRFASLFFITYLIVAFLILQNVLIARLYNGYKDSFAEHVDQLQQRRTASIDAAFSLLTGSSGSSIGQNTWEMFMTFFLHRHDSELHHLADTIFLKLDYDGSGSIELTEF